MSSRKERLSKKKKLLKDEQRFDIQLPITFIPAAAIPVTKLLFIGYVKVNIAIVLDDQDN